MAITKTGSVFKYKTIKTPLHKLPALLKLFIFLPLCIICMSLPSLFIFFGICFFIVTARFCGFTAREQFTDMKPALFYAFLMYCLSLFSNIIENYRNFTSIAAVFVPHSNFLHITLRLFIVIQLSALLFRTTSALEIREALCNLNLRFSNVRFGENISLFLCFIPEIFATYNNINYAWKARGGKNGFSKIKTVVFVLISLSLEKAAVKAKALEARRGL